MPSTAWTRAISFRNRMPLVIGKCFSRPVTVRRSTASGSIGHLRGTLSAQHRSGLFAPALEVGEVAGRILGGPHPAEVGVLGTTHRLNVGAARCEPACGGR